MIESGLLFLFEANQIINLIAIEHDDRKRENNFIFVFILRLLLIVVFKKEFYAVSWTN